MGFGARLQLLQRGRLHKGVTDIHHEPQPFTQMVGPLHHHIQRLDAALGHMTVRGYFRLAALEIEPDENFDFSVHVLPLSRVAATLRPLSNLGIGCDVRNNRPSHAGV